MKSYISEDVRGQVAALDAREKIIAKHMWRLWKVWAGVGVSAIAVSLLALFLGPDAHPSSVDVPAVVLQFFSGEATSGGIRGLGAVSDSLASGLDGLVQKIQRVAMPLALVMVLLGGAVAALSEDMRGGIKLAASGILFVGIIGMSQVFTGGNQGGSPKGDFMLAIEQHRFDSVERHLQAVGQEDTAAGLYVLAQVALALGETSDGARVRPEWEALINAGVAGSVAIPIAGFVPKAEVIYAIETAVYGKPVSVQAVAYQDERLAWQRPAKIGSAVLVGLSLAVSSALLGFLALRHSIRRRVRRIHGLLAEARA